MVFRIQITSILSLIILYIRSSLNVRGSHWVIISTFLTVLVFFGSMPSRDLPTMSKQQISAMVFMDVQCQSGTSDCGLFSIAFATSLCLGLDPVHITYTQGDIRNHRVISDFPQTKRKRYSVHKGSIVKYSVYIA